MTTTNENSDISELETLFLLNEDESSLINNKEESKTHSNNKTSKPKTFLEEIVALDENIDTLIRNESKASLLKFKLDKVQINDESSLIHNGDTDSSDDEEKKNCLEQRYNDCGRQIKDYLNKQQNEIINRKYDKTFNSDSKKNQAPSNLLNVKYELKTPNIPNKITEKKIDVYTDPIFGIRIINPTISSSTLIERMSGKLPISMAQIQRHIQNGASDSDWVVAGCIVSKSAVKVSQKGAQYSIWLISDLRSELKTVSLFLFRSAHKDLWKTNQGTVIGVLNPSVLDKRDGSKDEACLSVDNPQKIMILGQSKDLGICKSRKKNGDPCTAFVNTNLCEYCIFHVKQEYIQHSKRSELQSTFAGNGLRNSLRNKVLGKSEVFYGGQSYTALPAQKNRKHAAKDKNRLSMLSGQMTNSNKTIKQSIVNSLQVANKLNASRIDVTSSQREKDLERLRILKEYMPENTNVNNVLTNNLLNKNKLMENSNCDKNKKDIFIPKLSADHGKVINLNMDIPKVFSKANLKALDWVKKNGPIKKTDPSNLKGTVSGKKRILEELNQEQVNKKMKIEEKPLSFKSERFLKIMEASSMNEHLITLAEDEKQQKYFETLEKKEAMEEKMLNTFKLACKAVSCSICKYTSFSASEKCKTEKHPLKVHDAFKRFFKCQDCSNRTVTLDKIPKYSCKNCQGSHWTRAPMMKERIIKSAGEVLSIRGDEETFIGSTVSGGNINLLVPE